MDLYLEIDFALKKLKTAEQGTSPINLNALNAKADIIWIELKEYVMRMSMDAKYI